MSADFSILLKCLRDPQVAPPRPDLDERARALLREHALSHIAQALAHQNLDALLFKGAALVRTVYPKGAARPMSDIDMLARPGESSWVVQALVDAGATPESPLRRPYSGALLGESGLLLRLGNLSMWIEVHAHAGKLVPVPIALDECFARASRLSALPSLYVPSLEDHALLIAVDASQNEFRNPMALLDLELLFRAGMDWAALLACARRYRCTVPLFLALSILRSLGAASVRPEHMGAVAAHLSPLRRAALSAVFERRANGLFARGDFRLGLPWMLRQFPMRDDVGAYARGLLHYAGVRVYELMAMRARGET